MLNLFVSNIRSDFSFTSLTFFAFACEFSGIHKTEWGGGGQSKRMNNKR